MEHTHRKRLSGSETRKRHHKISFRVAPAEHAEIEKKASMIGVTLGSFVRESLLETPVTASRRRPAVEVEAVTKLQGEMNKIGSNIHQLLKRVNFQDMPATEQEYREALTGYRETVATIMEVLGRGRCL